MSNPQEPTPWNKSITTEKIGNESHLVFIEPRSFEADSENPEMWDTIVNLESTECQERTEGRLEGMNAVLNLLRAPSDQATLIRLFALRILLKQEALSGEALATRLGVTRSAINNAVQKLSKALGLPTERTDEAKEAYRQRAYKVHAKLKLERIATAQSYSDRGSAELQRNDSEVQGGHSDE